MKIRAIVTGATGMVGEGVLYECLNHADVESVLVLGRKSCNVSHPKLKEIIHRDFLDLTPIQSQLSGYNACYFCLGVSSVGLGEEQYHRLTHDLTIHAAQMLASENKDMVFCYVSGAGTDSTEKGRSMWARVKGKTENQIFNLPFKRAYAFRPGLIIPTPGLKNTLSLYKYLGWLIPVIKTIAPKSMVSLKQMGAAMINVTKSPYAKKILEVRDILELAQK